MSLLPSVIFSKSVSDSVDKVFSHCKLVKNGLNIDWRQYDKYLKRPINKIYYTRSPLENEKQNRTKNLISRVTIGSQCMHHEIVVEVDQIIFIVIYFGREGLRMPIESNLQNALYYRKDSKINKQKKLQGKKFSDLLDVIKKMKNSQTDYDAVLWNCQYFSNHIWNKF